MGNKEKKKDGDFMKGYVLKILLAGMHTLLCFILGLIIITMSDEMRKVSEFRFSLSLLMLISYLVLGWIMVPGLVDIFKK